MRAITAHEMRKMLCYQVYREELLEDSEHAQMGRGDIIRQLAKFLGHTRLQATFDYYVQSAFSTQESNVNGLRALALSLYAIKLGRRVGEVVSLNIDELALLQSQCEPDNCVQYAGEDVSSSRKNGYLCKDSKSWASSVRKLSETQSDAMAPYVPGLTSQQHDHDRVGALAAHLNALSEQLAPERQQPKYRLGALGQCPSKQGVCCHGVETENWPCLECHQVPRLIDR